MKKQGKKMPQTNQDTTAIESIESTVGEMLEKKFRIYTIKMIQDLKDDLSEQIQANIDLSNKEIRDQIQATIDYTNKEIREQIQVAKDYFKKEIHSLRNTKQKYLK